jgi:hypothetical protein
VSLLLAHGVGLHIVRETAGHSDVKVTMTVYAHGNLDQHAAALAWLGAAIGEMLPSTVAVNETTEEKQDLKRVLSCGSGGIRTPGTSRYARFQVVGEPCAGVCRRLPTCGFSRDPSDSAWDRQQSAATRRYPVHQPCRCRSEAQARRPVSWSLETSEGTRRQTSDGPGAVLAEPV